MDREVGAEKHIARVKQNHHKAEGRHEVAGSRQTSETSDRSASAGREGECEGVEMVEPESVEASTRSSFSATASAPRATAGSVGTWMLAAVGGTCIGWYRVAGWDDEGEGGGVPTKREEVEISQEYGGDGGGGGGVAMRRHP